jgi:hypothetical protein
MVESTLAAVAEEFQPVDVLVYEVPAASRIRISSAPETLMLLEVVVSVPPLFTILK